MPLHEKAPSPGGGDRGSVIAHPATAERSEAYPRPAPPARQPLIDFIAGYRAAGGEASAMMAATLAAFPGAAEQDFVAALLASHRKEAARTMSADEPPMVAGG